MNMHVTPRSPSKDAAAPSLWAVLMRSWLRVMIVSGLVGAMTFAGLAWFAQPQYAAVAELDLPEGQGAEAVVKALRSPALAEKLVTELGLARDPAFHSSMPSNVLGRLMQAAGLGKPREGDTAERRALVAYQRSLRVQPRRDGRRVTIEFVAPGPQLSARVVQSLVDTYLEGGADETTPQAVDVAALEKLAEEAAAAAALVERFRSATGIAARTAGTTDADSAALAEAVAQARRERDAAEARARTVRELLDRGNVEGIPDVHPSAALHELIAERVRIEVQKTTAERSLPAGHPRVRDLQVRLSELRWQMFREATTITEALEQEVAAAAKREGDARSRLDQARAGTRDAAADAVKLAALESDAAAKRAALEAAQSGHAAAPAQGESAVAGTAALAVPVQASQVPVSPRRGPMALLAAVSTLMIGFVLVIIRELVATTRRGSGDLIVDHAFEADGRTATWAPTGRPSADAAREPVAVPAVPTLTTAAPAAAQFTVLSSTGDAARHVATLASARRGYRTLLVGDGADIASEAHDFVSTLASSGHRSVLVDWSRDGKGVATSLGLLPAQPGINDLLAGHATFEDVIARLPDSDAHVVSCGSPARLGAPLDPDWINLVLDALDEAYDHIVVVSRLEPARALFEVIEGRFDAGIVMSDGRSQGASINAAPGVFLGFEVADIHVVELDVAQRGGFGQRRFKRSRRQAAVA